MALTVSHGDVTYADFDVGALVALKVPQASIIDAMRSAAKTQMLAAVEQYRHRLSGAEAGVARPGPERVGIWSAKARLARAYKDAPDTMPDVAPGFFKSRMTREAEAKGRTLGEQLQRIAAKADVFEGLGLLIDAMEAEAEAGLAAVTDEQAIAGGFEAYLEASRAAADQAFAEGLAAMGAG